MFIIYRVYQENVYMIHHDLDLFYDIYNTINTHNWRKTHYLSLIPNYFDIYFYVNQKVFHSIFECVICSSSVPMEEIKLLAIVNWIFHVSIFLDYLWCVLSMVYFYYNILQLIVFYSYHRYFRIQNNCYSKNYLLLLIYNNLFLLHSQNDF